MKRILAPTLLLASLAAQPTLTLSVGPAVGIGENLLPNGGFEDLENDAPVGWSVNPGKALASIRVSPRSYAGSSSVFLSNAAPMAPHVFGQLNLKAPLSLKDGEKYTLSAFVLGDNPGSAWMGGGPGWTVRVPIPKTSGSWQRIRRTFTAPAGSAQFPFMINTDSPTPGFWVDGIKLERGDQATPYVEEPARGRDAIILMAPAPRLGSSNESLELEAVLKLLRDGEITVGLASKGAARKARIKAGAGVQRLVMRLAEPGSPSVEGRPISLKIECLGESREVSFVWYAGFDVAAAEAAAKGERDRLSRLVEAAKSRALAQPYARATVALSERFLRIAAEKRQLGLIAEALEDFAYLRELCRGAAAQQERVDSGKETPMVLPDPDLKKITLRGGSFWVGNEPVVLLGGMGYGELRDEMDAYREYGFNSVGDDWDSFSAIQMMKSMESADESVFPKLKASWDDLARRNLAVSYNPTLHYFPFWATQEFLDINGGDPVDVLPDWSGRGRHQGKRHKLYGGFFPFAIDSENLRQLVAAYYKRIGPAVESHPAFRITWLMNEPTYKSRDAHYVALFREAMEKRYVSVDRLNAAWKTQFASFSQVGIPADRTPGQYDWKAFHQDQVASWFEWLGKTFRASAPKAILSSKPMGWCLLDPTTGIDFEREALAWDVPGCDSGFSPYPAGDFAYGWTEPILVYDFQKSVAPEKPLANHEYHYVHEPEVSAEYAYATYWQSHLHGLRLSEFWVWSKGDLRGGDGAAGMTHTAWSQPKVAWGTSKAAIDLRRLARVLTAFPGKPEAYLLYSKSSFYGNQAVHAKTLKSVYSTVNSLDAPVGFMTERMILQGDLSKAKLLIIPGASVSEKNVAETVRAWAEKGGRVVLVGDCFSSDPWGEALPEIKGQRFVEAAARELAPAFDKAFSEAGVSRPIRAKNALGGSAWPLEVRTSRLDGKRLVYLLGLQAKTMTVELEAAGGIKAWEDLVTGEKGTAPRFTVKPCDVRILRVE
ncbi:MAG: beta-galactosidase [Spirochaetes bacterium]|nr:beta-galactosidase [Spirochaetota bacterium]